MKTETAEKILNAAVERFAEKGYKNTTTLDIAYSSGVNETTIFKHFKNKKTLFQKAFFAMTPDKSLVPTKELTMGEDLEKDLSLFIRNYMILHINHMPAYRISMLLDEVYDKEIYAESFQRIEGMIEQFEMYLVDLNKQGKIRPMDYKAITEFLFSLFLTKATEFIINAQKNSGDTESVDEFTARYASYISSLLSVN